MRRGKLNKSSFTIIIISAFFTILSYVSDQLVINHENKSRILNSKFQNLNTDIQSIESIASKVTDVQIKMESFLSSEIKKRHIFLKQLIVLGDSTTSLSSLLAKDEFTKLFPSNEYREAMIDNIKFQTINNTREFIIDTYEIINDVHLIGNNKFLNQISFFSKEEFFKKLSEDIVYQNNLDKFSYNDFELFWSTFAKNDIYSKLKFNDWVNIRNYKLAYMETILNSYEELTPVIEQLDVTQAQMEESLEVFFLDIKNNNNLINYFILTGIISQILTLFFLLLLFRSLIKKNII
jgi:hypothetical protein